MKRHIYIGATVITALLTVLLLTGASGQGGGGRPQSGGGMNRGAMPPPPAQVEMQFAAGNLFILQGTTLTKYDATTLKVTGSCALSGDAATATVTGQRAQALPPAPSLLIVTGADENAALLVVAGGTFYRILASDMTVAVKKALPVAQNIATMAGGPTDEPKQMGAGDAGGPDDGGPANGMLGEPDGGQMDGPPEGGPPAPGEGQPGGAVGRQGMSAGRAIGMPPMATRPSYLLHDNTLFLLNGSQLLAINTLTGEVLSQATVAGSKASQHKQ